MSALATLVKDRHFQPIFSHFFDFYSSKPFKISHHTIMSHYNSEQATQLKDIGQYLQQQRLAQKFTLEDIADQTFIRLTVLESLENGNIDQLPERVYVQGFIRRYADLLGINGEKLVKNLSEIPDDLSESVSDTNADKFEKYIDSSSPSPSTRSQTQTLPPPSPSKRTQSASKASLNRKKGNPLLMLLGLAILGGLGAYWYLFRTPSPPELTFKEESEEISPKTELTPSPSPLTSPMASITPSPSPLTSPIASITPSPSPMVSITPSPSPSPVVSPVVSETPLSLKAVATADTWLSVTADGKEIYAGILKEGEEQQWKAEKNIEIRTGNAGGIKLGMNDAPLEPLGQLGEVKEATFKAETLQ